MAAASPFTPKAFAFLRGLRRHNSREWFEAHRPDYQHLLLDPMRAAAARIGSSRRCW